MNHFLRLAQHADLHALLQRCQAALDSPAQHAEDCPVRHGASADCVTGAECDCSRVAREVLPQVFGAAELVRQLYTSDARLLIRDALGAVYNKLWRLWGPGGERRYAPGSKVFDGVLDLTVFLSGEVEAEASRSKCGPGNHRYLPSKGCTWKCACGDSFVVCICGKCQQPEVPR